MWLTVLLPLLGVITENITIFQLYNSFLFLALQEAKNLRGLTKLFLCVLAKASARISFLRHSYTSYSLLSISFREPLSSEMKLLAHWRSSSEYQTCFSEGSEQLESNAETALGFYTKSKCSC